jgi:nucleoside-diphosphate-sugar epimerase
VHGGQQIRPNIHINDISRAILFFLKKKKNRYNIYNIGFENLKILEIAKKIQKKIKCKIKIKKIRDIRSYRLDSTRLLKEGFRPIFKVDDAINELSNFFKRDNFKESYLNHNIPVVKNILKKKSDTYKVWKNKFYK